MIRFLATRLVAAGLTLLAVMVITFLIIHAAPGDPAVYAAGVGAPPGFLIHVRAQLGLNRPIPIQLLIYLSRLVRGQFGYSFFWQAPVNTIILQRLPATLLLIGTSLVISTIGGIGLGMAAARAPFGKRDGVITVLSQITFSLPQFWVGMVLLLIFGVWLKVAPIQGIDSVSPAYTGWRHVLDVLEHLALPAVALGLTDLAVFTRMTRASILEIVQKDFMRTARSKGISENRTFFAHGLRNAVLPLVTLMGLRFRDLFAGAVLIEAIFSWPGVGLLTLQSLQSYDYPMILGIVFWAAVLVIAGNFLADILYTRADPRIEYW